MHGVDQSFNFNSSPYRNRREGINAGPGVIFPPATYPRHDACEAWRFSWLASGVDPPSKLS